MTRVDDSQETLLDAFAASIEVAGDGRACPTWEAIWKSAHRELERREEDVILMHVGECPACAASWRMARDLALDAADRPAAPVNKMPRRMAWMPLAAAAVLVVAVAGVGIMWIAPDEQEPAYRTIEGEWLRPEIPLEEPLARDDCLLRWTPGPMGSTYKVRVTSENLEIISVGRWLDEPEFLVSATALEELPPGSRIFWQVSARLPDGHRVDSASFISRIE